VTSIGLKGTWRSRLTGMPAPMITGRPLA